MKKWGYHCAMLLYVCMGTAGILLAITNAFQLKYQKAEVFSIILLFCAIETLLLLMEKKSGKVLAWSVSIGSVLLLYLLRGETLRESLLCIKRSVLETAEEYFQIYLGSYFNVDASVDYGMVVLGILIGMLLSYGIVCMKHSWMPVVLLGVGILIPFTVGKVPKMAEVVLCMLSVGGIVAAKTERGFQVQRRSGFVGVILVAAALAVGSMFSGMQVQKAFGDRKDVTKQISELLKEKSLDFFGKAKGGVNDGVIGGAGEFAKDDEKQLVITSQTKPQEKIYLQGYIGTIYEDNKWKEGRRKEFQSWIRQRNAQTEEVRNLLYEKLKTVSSQETFYIENVGANTKYKYIPYGGYYTEKDEIVSDSYVKGDAKKYDIQYCPLGAFGFAALENTKSPLENAYFKYVSKYDTEVPAKVEKSFLEEVEKRVPATDVWSVMDEIAQVLDGQAEYSLEPGKTPVGEDVAEYFYFKNKKGYCEHFATVATLMLRMKGIPARYVAGYAVLPSAFKLNEEGEYEAVVTGASAHARAEAYVQGIGWIPVETTPGYSGNTMTVIPDEMNTLQEQTESQLQKSESKKDETQQNELQDKQEETDEENNQSGEGKDKLSAEENEKRSDNPLHMIVGIFMGMFLIAFTVLFGRRVWILKKRRISRNHGYTEYVKELFHRMFELLVLAGKVEKSEEVDGEFTQKLCKAYPNIREEDVDQVVKIVYQANFGNEKIEKEEYQMCRKLYCQIKREVSVDVVWWKKIWWKYWNGISL